MASSSTDDVDATDGDVSIDCFAGLDVEAGDGESAHIDNEYVGFIAQRRGDTDCVPTGCELQTATDITLRRVFVAKGER